jgi:hypothetical protein
MTVQGGVSPINMSDVVKCPKCYEKHNLACPECGAFWGKCSCADKDFDNEPEQLFCINCQDIFWHIPLDKTETDQEGDEDDVFTGDGDYVSMEFAMTAAKQVTTKKKPQSADEIPLSTEIKEAAKPTQCNCTKPKKYFCGKCRVARSSQKASWQKLDKVTKPKTGPWKGGTQAYTHKCRHYHIGLDLGNGVIMHTSSMNNERKAGGETQVTPDFGLYADYGWKPTWRNEMIAWPDFGIPKVYDTACEQIKDAYYLAKGGADVEIGCIGGHGRTGTILACMYVYASNDMKNPKILTAKEAVDKVHKDYCEEAVESASQEWFIEYFSNYFFDTPLSSKTVPAKTYGSKGLTLAGSTNMCSLAEHVAMIWAGHTECAADPGSCTWWDRDVITISEKKGEYSEAHQAAVNKKAAEFAGKFPLKDKVTDKASKTPVPASQADTDFDVLATGVCSQTEHYAMFLHGWELCTEAGHNCKYWAQDFKAFNENDLTDVFIGQLQKAVDECDPIKPGGKTFNAIAAIPVGATCDGERWTGLKWEPIVDETDTDKTDIDDLPTLEEVFAGKGK